MLEYIAHGLHLTGWVLILYVIYDLYTLLISGL